ncbi:hypothetical protein [Gordonia malaquae]|uniref:hypothetical protein n=1 Tax=Gordonia malaquae TaxID=410332 RepID=UPI00301AE2AE
MGATPVDGADGPAETEYWLSQPGIAAIVEAGECEYARGRTTSLAELRAELE